MTEEYPDIRQGQELFARKADEVSSWGRSEAGKLGLLEVVKNVKPTMLVRQLLNLSGVFLF